MQSIKLAFFLAAAARAAEITVNVGPGLVYSPSSITANVGDTVNFVFKSSHTVTQTLFSAPCGVLEGGFYLRDSGSITINSTDPIYYNCQIPGHCTSGMVGAINAPTSGDETFANFQSAAESGDASSATVTAPAMSATASGMLPSGLYAASQSGFSAFPADASYSLVSSGSAVNVYEVVETFSAASGSVSAATGTLVNGPSAYVLSISASGAPSGVNEYASCSVSGSSAVCVGDAPTPTTFTAPFAPTMKKRSAGRWA